MKYIKKFESIDGLSFSFQLDNRTEFNIINNIKYIIKQITLEDFLLKFNSLKYNL